MALIALKWCGAVFTDLEHKESTLFTIGLFFTETEISCQWYQECLHTVIIVVILKIRLLKIGLLKIKFLIGYIDRPLNTR